MKKLIWSLSFFLVAFMNAQNVVFNKVEKTHQNEDKFLYKIENTKEAFYLGEIEVQGFSNNDVEVFDKIYKKAKEIGANTFKFKPFEGINGTQNFDPHHYKLSFYYIPKEELPVQQGKIFIFSSEDKAQKVRVNKNDFELSSRSYKEILVEAGKTYEISTKKLFGSSVKFLLKENQPAQYFQIFSNNLKSGNESNPGLIFKSGDIISLEKSFAEFLTIIYKKKK